MTELQKLNTFFNEAFPDNKIEVLSIGQMQATLRYPITAKELRPGNTVSGPTLMATADAALYAAILGEIGLVALAVTTSLNFNFLRKPESDRDIIAKCQLIKLGKSLAVGEVSLYSEGKEAMVAHAVGTYSIPPQR